MMDKSESKECVICLDDYKIGCKISYLPCFHFFHSLCIKNWIQQTKRCPICKIDIKFD